MITAFENKSRIGSGIYTMPDIAQILRLPNYKVNRWIKTYWDEKLGKQFNQKYSWTVDNTKAVSFHTLVELYTFYHLNSAGVKTQKVLKAHQILAEKFDTLFPFANANILQGLRTDGNKIYLESDDETIITLDGTHQLNFNFITVFFKLLDFDDEALACRLWPIGKENSIVCDPERQFGHPVINNTNIYPEAIYNMFEAGESIPFIASIYDISANEINDAIRFCKKAA
jgi:uncharacterized protein (DUF433 family)